MLIARIVVCTLCVYKYPLEAKAMVTSHRLSPGAIQKRKVQLTAS